MIKKIFKKTYKNDNFLEHIPHIKYNNWENNSGTVTLFFYRNSFVEKFICFLFKKSKVTDIKLDKLSSEVWLMIDGKKSVANINELLCHETGDNFDTGCKRLIMFFRYLLHKGWIGF